MTLKIKVKVKFKVTKIKPIYEFLLMINSKHAPNLHHFQVIATLNIKNSATLNPFSKWLYWQPYWISNELEK